MFLNYVKNNENNISCLNCTYQGPEQILGSVLCPLLCHRKRRSLFLDGPRYLFRAYFWLDVIALISLLPDTWLFREVFESNQDRGVNSEEKARPHCPNWTIIIYNMGSKILCIIFHMDLHFAFMKAKLFMSSS